MMNDRPKNVYKYLSPDRTGNVLEKLLIRFSQASVLNDALEFKPPLKGMGTRSEVEKGVRERFQAKHPWIFAQLKLHNSPEKADQLFAEIVSAAADQIETPANYERSVKEVYKKLDENFGVLSFVRDAIERPNVGPLRGWWSGLFDRV